MRRIAGALTEYVQRSAATVARARGSGHAAAGAERLAAALWRLQAGSLVAERSEVGAPRADAGRSDSRHLDWLGGARVRAGVLALWQDDPVSGRLRITSTYDPEGLLHGLLDTATTAEHFPPAPLIWAARPADRGVCVVIPVRTRDHDWGLLAVISEIDTSSTRGTYQRWVASLCAVFEEEALQQVVRASEARYALVTRATNDGLWEWDVLTGHVYLSGRCVTLLGLDLDPPASRLEQWESLVHPDDQAAMRPGMRAAIIAPGEPVAAEYRVRAADGSYRWLLARALGVQAATGHVERAVGSLTDIHERRRLEYKLRENALHDVEPAGVTLFVQRVQAGFAQVLVLDGHEIAIRASMGIATSAVGYARAEDVLRDADAAMYRANAVGQRSGSRFTAVPTAYADHEAPVPADLLPTHDQ